MKSRERLPGRRHLPHWYGKMEKRNIALEIPAWDTKTCIQCGKCAYVCPHAVLRIKVYDSKELAGAPATFKSSDPKDKDWAGLKYTIQVAPEDCTGCGICVDICPAKNKSETRLKAINMVAQPPLREPERENWDFFLKIPSLIAVRSKCRISVSSRCKSRYSNFRERVPVAARRPISNSFRSYLEIVR